MKMERQPSEHMARKAEIGANKIERKSFQKTKLTFHVCVVSSESNPIFLIFIIENIFKLLCELGISPQPRLRL